MQSEEIIQFLKGNIEPLEDSIYGAGYRVSAYLTDGTYLPCVIFRNPDVIVELAIKRLKEKRSEQGFFNTKANSAYRDMVENFVTKGNRVNAFDIKKIEKSPFAFPLHVLSQIRGETTMGWTGFAARMKDGKYVGFGTRFRHEFFDMPENYSLDDIEEIVNHSYVLETGELKKHNVPFYEHPKDYVKAIVYRERPYFDCYIETL